LTNDTYYRLLALKKVHGISIQDSIEFLATHHLQTLEERFRVKEAVQKTLYDAIDNMASKAFRLVQKM
jgi:hypothetical protein